MVAASLKRSPLGTYQCDSCILYKNFFATETTEITEIFLKVFSVDSVANLLVVDLVETWFRLVRVRDMKFKLQGVQFEKKR